MTGGWGWLSVCAWSTHFGMLFRRADTMGGLIFQQVRDPPILIVQFRRADNGCDMNG